MTPKNPTDPSEQIEALWNDHHDGLVRSIARWSGRTKDDHDVQEAIAATFDRLLQHLSRGRNLGEHQRSWLIVIARREFIRTITRSYNRDSELYGHDKSRILTDGAPQPDEYVLDQAHHTLDGALDAALARLTRRQRSILTDVHAGYSYTEIQERYGLSFTAVNKTLTKARARLRKDAALEKAYREWSD